VRACECSSFSAIARAIASSLAVLSSASIDFNIPKIIGDCGVLRNVVVVVVVVVVVAVVIVLTYSRVGDVVVACDCGW
jgi:hypothetical protein